MKEKITTIIIILISVLAPILIIPRNVGSTYFAKLIILLVLGTILLFLFLLNYKKVNIDKKDTLLLIFGGLVILSTFLSSNIKNSIIGEKDRYEGMLTFFVYILIFFSSKKIFKENYIKKFINIMYIVILIICTLSIFQYYIVKIDLPPIFFKRKYGGSSATFGNSNFFGSFVSIFLPISMSAYIINGKKKYLISTVLLFAGMLVSIARSSWVAFLIYFIIMIAYCIYKRKKEYFKRFILILITFICTFMIISFTGKENIIKKHKTMISEIKQVTTTGITDKMGSSRIEIWKVTLRLIQKHPLIGVGVDNLKDGLYKNIDMILDGGAYQFTIKSDTVIDKAHNEYLQIAATIGIPALIIYLIFIGIIVLKNLKLSIKNNARFIMLMSIISYLIQAFFNISTIGVAPLFWLMLGLISNDEVVRKINENINNEEEICT